MTYFGDVYLRLYWLFCSFPSWILVLIVFVVGVFLVGGAWESGHKYRRQILYYFTVAVVLTFLFRVTFWLLAPSPSYLGIG